ncbi:Polyadenylate-binding protein 3 [Zea mays]|uniref:Polyadenylate-binding protein 3 n=1 Tax=Zea mays TaxID=4577 RepID=A0A1D6HKU4_MAIZE|nr:Polyadenylate-binding protein 3 [Zea mays]
MATLIDHTGHRISPHMVMGGLLDSAALCATDLTSEVRGRVMKFNAKPAHGHWSVPGIINCIVCTVAAQCSCISCLF